MARPLMFQVLGADSPLHRWDARCKLIALCVLTTLLVHGEPPVLLLCTWILLGAMGASRLPWRVPLGDLRAWSVLLAVVFLVQGWDTSSEARPVDWLPATEASLHQAGLALWRLALILAFSALFSRVTRAKAMQEALLWFMKPLPFLPARRMALMMSLVVRFLPLTLGVLEEVRLAHRARFGDRVRSPLKRIRQVILPVFRKVLGRADEMAAALEARGYREDLKPMVPPFPARHALPLVALLLILSSARGLSGFLLRGAQQGANLLLNFFQGI